jgi:hypothetical protein
LFSHRFIADDHCRSIGTDYCRNAMNTLTTRWRAAGLALWLAATASLPAAAHHSVAMFGQSKHAEFSGTVAKLLWANPHVWLCVTVERQGSAP